MCHLGALEALEVPDASRLKETLRRGRQHRRSSQESLRSSFVSRAMAKRHRLLPVHAPTTKVATSESTWIAMSRGVIVFLALAAASTWQW